MQLPNVTYNQPISPPSNAITSIYTLTFVFRANLNDKHFSLKCQGYAFLNFVIVFFSLFLGCTCWYEVGTQCKRGMFLGLTSVGMDN